MRPFPRLDDVDGQIVELLRQDARRTVKDIAARVNLSPAPVKRRIDRLEASGVIAGYTLRLDHSKLGPSVEAFTELRYSGEMTVDEILESLAEIAEVVEVYITAGDADALLHLRVDDIAHLQRVIGRLRGRRNLVTTRTSIVLERRTGGPTEIG